MDQIDNRPWPSDRPVQHFHMGGGKGNTILVVGGLAVLCVGGYLIYRALAHGKDITEDLEFSVDPLQETVGSGKLCKANVSVTNVSKKDTVAPKIRFDIKNGTSGWTTVNENPAGFIPFGDIAPGDTVTQEMSMLIPSNWLPGSEVYGRVVCQSHKGVVWTDLIATIPTPMSITVTAEPVAAIVGSGGVVQVVATFNNPNDSSVDVAFALDLRRSGSGKTWIPAPSESGNFPYKMALPPGETTATLTSEIVPPDWGAGVKIAARIIGIIKMGNSWGMKHVYWGGDKAEDFIFTVGGSASQVFLQVTCPGLDGFKAKCVPVGGKFEYTFQVNNTSGGPLNADFIVGWRTQGFTDKYVEQPNVLTLPVGISRQTVYSKQTTQTWSGDIVDLRVLVRGGATVIAGDTTTDEEGVQAKKIYEGDRVGYIGASQLQAYSNESFVISMIPVDRKVSKLGQKVIFDVGVKHIGPAKSYKVGAWIRTNEGTNGGYWIGPITFDCAEHTDVTPLKVELAGQFKATTLKVGTTIDCLFAFMESGVTVASPPQTQQFLFANWDAILTVK